MNAEDDLVVLISAIEHFAYCPRQCSLIHVEQTFDENEFTVRGTGAHERVDSGAADVESGVRFVRGIPLWSERHGLRGKSDLVELRPGGPYPVEYKSGPRKGRYAEFQLCAQALCLEEMLGEAVPRGAVYHRASATRREIAIDDALRAETLAIVQAIRGMLAESDLPPPVNDARCNRCSLKEACLPELTASPGRLEIYERALFEPENADGP